MRLNLSTDYAVRILILLASDEQQLFAVSDVATAYDIPRSTVMKLVSELVRMGYVDSVRGRSGGIRLARQAGLINLGEVIRRTEDNVFLAECVGCVIAPKCRLKGVFAEALQAFWDVLARYTLADLVENRDELRTLFRPFEGVQQGSCHQAVSVA